MIRKLEVSAGFAARIHKLSEEACLSVDTLLTGALNKWVRGMTGTGRASIASDLPAPYGEKPFVASRGEELAVGLRLRMRDKRKAMREARVRADGIVIAGMEDKKFQNLSAAARSLRDNNQINGWPTWQYWNEEKQSWRSAQELRRG